MNYKIIADEDKFRDFINLLPQLEKNESYFCMLLARSKYTDKVLPKTECCIKRFISSKEHLYDKIKQLECEAGTYKWNDVELLNDSLVILINPNPRNLKKAAKNTLIELAKTIESDINPSSIAMTEIQSAVGTKNFVQFDVDGSAVEDFLSFAEDKINRNAFTIIKTRGGFHLLIKPNLVESKFTKTWYQNISKFQGVDRNKSDFCTPIPYCTQGAFMPYIVE